VIPIRDTVRSRSLPFATLFIVTVNVYVFMQEISLGSGIEHFMHRWALLPGLYTRWSQLGFSVLSPGRYIPLITSMFLHGGWAHILGNMLYLWVFGGHVEDRIGHARFLTFYLLCGLAAAAAQIWASPYSMLPIVGASGAIAGVLGGYFVLFPRARILTLIPIFIFPWFVEIPAFFFLGIWFLMQLLSGTLELGVETAQSGGVAWWAHAGGFLAGIVLVILMPRRAPQRRRFAPGY
jgi:membrane associated rhomboid family serine protease